MFKCGNRWAEFNRIDITNQWGFTTRDWMTFRNLSSIKKDAFNKFLRENVRILGILSYCFIKIEVDEKKLRTIYEILQVESRTKEVKNLLFDYISGTKELDELKDEIVPVKLALRLSRSS